MYYNNQIINYFQFADMDFTQREYILEARLHQLMIFKYQ